MSQPSEPCALGWVDGWGEHDCALPLDHEGGCRCRCDATNERGRERAERETRNEKS